MLLALLLYRMDLSQKIVSIGVIVIYVAASFLAGFMVGKKIGNRKFLWGFLMGSAYFGVLAVISILMNHSAQGVAENFFTVYVICAGSGMLGNKNGVAFHGRLAAVLFGESRTESCSDKVFSV